ncbi:MAG: peptidoglycan-associated lipoprotein Pal [Betaproteobacteria bacterium]|nr:peptidoglycan-associated lipoprotein Pal [Betaproteobacteria bacterium]NBY04547.1 peptidoglycan-associated lipoprotein Pal [Betaproteobacteria bacterium]
MNKTLITLTLAALLAACSSPVKLNEVPVEEKAGVALAAPSEQAPPPPARSAVAGIDARPLTGVAPGPEGVTKVIYFDYDSFVIKSEFQSVIEKHAAYIKQDSKRRIALEGHTDERGGREYNLALGQKRSEAVRKALNLLGVSDAQMEAVSFGKEKPAVQGNSEEAFAKNRRAEIAYK